MNRSETAGLYDAHMHSAHCVRGDRGARSDRESTRSVLSRTADFNPLPGRLVFSCAASPEDWPVLLSESGQEIRIFLGLHPQHIPSSEKETDDLLVALEEHLRSAPRAGVGECGLDRRYYRETPRRRQERVLRFQIHLAALLGRPLNLHQVRAAGALAEVLEDERPGVPLIIHGFREKEETARRLLRLGAHLSFGPGGHWEKEDFLALFRALPRDRILLESDWPYASDSKDIPGAKDVPDAKVLPEQPYLQTMESLYEKAAAVLGIDKEELAALVRENGTVFTHRPPDRS